MTQKVIGIVKVVNEAKNFIGMGDGKGKWMFLNIDKIEDKHPNEFTQWQKTIFLVDDKQKIEWGDEDPKYFKEAAYSKNTIQIPEPIPDKFTQEYVKSNSNGANINLDITPIVTILNDIKNEISVHNKVMNLLLSRITDNTNKEHQENKNIKKPDIYIEEEIEQAPEPIVTSSSNDDEPPDIDFFD